MYNVSCNVELYTPSWFRKATDQVMYMYNSVQSPRNAVHKLPYPNRDTVCTNHTYMYTLIYTLNLSRTEIQRMFI